MRKAKTTTVALSTVAALLATGGAAAAVATSGGDGTGQDSAQATQADAAAGHAPKGDGARKLCKRAPKTDKRIDRVLRRLDGDVSRRGSLERLEKRIALARKAGHTPVADFLNERLKDRRSLGPRLEDRQKDLKKLRSWCAEQKEQKQEKQDGSGTEG